MFSIETQRLRLIPLNIVQLELLVKGRHVLESAMELKLSNFELNADSSFLEEFQTAIESYTIPAVKANADKYFWYTHWLIIEKATNLTIGGVGMAGEPDESGQVILGYFIDKKWEGKGFATESVASMLTWVLKDASVKAIIADTPAAHIGSQKVLKKNGFHLLGETDEGLRWIRVK